MDAAFAQGKFFRQPSHCGAAISSNGILDSLNCCRNTDGFRSARSFLVLGLSPTSSESTMPNSHSVLGHACCTMDLLQSPPALDRATPFLD